MTDEHVSPEQVAFEADLDRLRAAVGPAALEEASRRGIGDQMLVQALLSTMDAAEAAQLGSPMRWWRTPLGWGDDD